MSTDSSSTSDRLMVSNDEKSGKVRVWRYVYEVSDVLPQPVSKKAKTPPTSQSDLPKQAVHPANQPKDKSPGPSTSSSTAPSTSTSTSQPIQPFAPRSKASIPSTPTQDTITKTLSLAQQSNLDEPNGRLNRTSSISGVSTNGRAVTFVSQSASQQARRSPLAAPRAASQAHNRIPSQSRNDLSITMDRMALGSGAGEDIWEHGPSGRVVDDRRMRSELWVECLYELDVGMNP